MWAGVGVGEWRVKMSFKFGNSKRLSATMAGFEQSDKNDKNERKIFPGKCLWTPWAPARIEDRARKQLFTDMLFFFLKKTNFVYIQVLVHTMMSNREITNGLFKY